MTTTNATSGTGGRLRIPILVLLWTTFAAIALYLVWMFAGLFFVFGLPDAGPYRSVVEDPAGEFSDLTGLTWPSNATIVSVGDSHGGFHGDGEFHLIFDADHVTLESWLNQAPPWDQESWHTGPVPTEISSHCRWGSSEDANVETWSRGSNTDTQPDHHSRPNDIRYVARERCCESIAWHNGHLLVLDLASNRVLLSVWDF